MDATVHMDLQFQELDEMEAPSWESFYNGVLSSLAIIAIGAAAAT